MIAASASAYEYSRNSGTVPTRILARMHFAAKMRFTAASYLAFWSAELISADRYVCSFNCYLLVCECVLYKQGGTRRSLIDLQGSNPWNTDI